MMSTLIAKGVELQSTSFSQEWNEAIVLRLEDELLTITFTSGAVSLVQEDTPDAHSIVQLSKKRLCDIIDGSIDFMIVWRELAEPSPTDRTYILKGSGVKLFALLDSLIKCYQSNIEFKQLVDDYKVHLTG